MTFARWNPCPGYTVESWGNGLAYCVTGPGGVSFYLQGDDAAQWREEYDSAFDLDRVAAFMADSMADFAPVSTVGP